MTKRSGVVLLAAAGIAYVVLTRPAYPPTRGASAPEGGNTAPAAEAFLNASEALEIPGFRVAATHYWQGGWNYTFWSSFREAMLDEDFRKIRALSFNTVVTSVPWGYFQTDAYPPTYDERAFEKLETFLDAAAEHDLYVVLRVGTPELIPRGIQGGSYYLPVMMYEDRELDAYCDLYREVSRRVAGRANLLFIFGSWEDIGYLTPLKVSAGESVPLRSPASFVDFLRHRTLDHWNRRWSTGFTSFDEIHVPGYGSAAAWDFLEFASERLKSVVLPRIGQAAQQGHPGIRLGFEVRVDAEPVWFRGRDRDPEWFFHHRTWDLPDEYGIIGAYFNPYWKAPNDGGHISPGDAAQNLELLVSEIENFTDGRPIFFDQLNFTDSTPLFSHNSKLRDEEAIASFLELVLPEIHRRSIGYAIWAFRSYEAGVLYNPTFEDGLDGWQTSIGDQGLIRVVMDSQRREKCLRLDPAARVERTERAIWNPGCHSPEVPYTLRVDVRGDRGSRLNVVYEVPTADLDSSTDTSEDWGVSLSGWRTISTLEIEPTMDWQEHQTELPFSTVFRLVLVSAGTAALELDEVMLFNHVQTAAVYGPRGEEIGHRAEVLGKVNRTWSDQIRNVEQAVAPSWDRDEITTLDGVSPDGWAGPEVTVPIHVPWRQARLMIDTFLPDETEWQEGNEVQVWRGRHAIGQSDLRVGFQTLEVALPEKAAPGPCTLRLSFARFVCPEETVPSSADKRRLSAVLLGIRVQPAVRLLERCWVGEIVNGPVEVYVEVANSTRVDEVQVLLHVQGEKPMQGRIGEEGNATFLVSPSPSDGRSRPLYVELLNDHATIAEVKVEPKG